MVAQLVSHPRYFGVRRSGARSRLPSATAPLPVLSARLGPLVRQRSLRRTPLMPSPAAAPLPGNHIKMRIAGWKGLTLHDIV